MGETQQTQPGAGDRLDKVYNPQSVEPAIYQQWEEQGCFDSVPSGNAHEQTYCIVIPPPNVTGALHLGHALNNTLQDILTRYHRMRGFDTLWQPGTDHAGIATQAVVEKRIRELEGKSRHDLGREEMVRRIWQWKDEYEQRIVSQLKLMGCSCDWKRNRFTLDDGLAQAVRHQFFNLFRDGLIFRGKRLVNWDTQLQTAVADDEVYYDTIQGHFWHFKYPVIDAQPGEPEHVIIATTRPETMLGDTAVAVHPDPASFFDKREAELREALAGASNKDRADAEAKLEALLERRASKLDMLVQLAGMAKSGRKLRLPLVNRAIPLIADEWADPSKGSGCVKITPAHDPNDYDVWQRQKEKANDIGAINVLSPDGHIGKIVELDGSENAASSQYEGLPFAKDGRAKVVADIEAAGLLDQIEDHEVEMGHSDRSKTAIEPYLSDQWFLRTDDDDTPGLATRAMGAVTGGDIEVHPSRYGKSYLDWLGEKRDWCISRQLWWGHRIPVWMRSEDGGAPAGDGFEARTKAWIAEGRLCTQHSDAPAGESTGNTYCIRDEQDSEIATFLEAAGYRQEEDVLDTWFSSALWPFSTLGWPEQTAHLQQYYPTSVLCTSRDIITNWVARMVMFGLYSMGKKPFDDVYIHPKILDGRGETMSKSKGNGVDPVDIIHTYGADALRYTMAEMCTETQDIRMPVEYICPHCQKLVDQGLALKAEEQRRKSTGQKLDRKIQPSDCARVMCKACGMEFATQWALPELKAELPVARETSDKFEAGRNFTNKLWNAARFAFMNAEGAQCASLDVASLAPEDRWILSSLSRTIRAYHACLGRYQFSASVRELRDFFWDSLCDWYIELTKPRFADGADAESQATAKQILAFCLDQVLRLWHPTMPFITERLWTELNAIAPDRGLPGFAELESSSMLISAAFPPFDAYPALDDAAMDEVFAEIQNVVRAVRDLRSRCDVSPKTSVAATVALPEAHRAAFEAQTHIVKRMANVGSISVDPEAKRPANAGSVTFGSMRVYVHDITDDQAERQRTTKELQALDKQIKGKESKLSNEKFVGNAKPEVVQAERDRLTALLEQQASLQAHLSELGS